MVGVRNGFSSVSSSIGDRCGCIGVAGGCIGRAGGAGTAACFIFEPPALPRNK